MGELFLIFTFIMKFYYNLSVRVLRQTTRKHFLAYVNNLFIHRTDTDRNSYINNVINTWIKKTRKIHDDTLHMYYLDIFTFLSHIHTIPISFLSDSYFHTRIIFKHLCLLNKYRLHQFKKHQQHMCEHTCTQMKINIFVNIK